MARLRIAGLVVAAWLATVPAAAQDDTTEPVTPFVAFELRHQEATAAQPPRVQPDGFDWHAATLDSVRFLLLQQGARIVFREHVREGLTGPFFRDYVETLGQKPTGFSDGDHWVTNFIGHSIQGSVTYRIARVNGATRGQAFWWGVFYSTQFELGPLGEAAIGNIPISPVDLVVTPLLGFALGVAEEWLIDWLPKRGERWWLLTRPLVLGHVIVRLVCRK